MIRRFPHRFLLIALALLSLSAHGLELGDPVQVLTGNDGVTATLAPTAKGDQALIKVTGVDHALDGVVLLANIEQRPNDERAYRSELDGKMRTLVLFARSYWASTDYTVYIPGREEPYALAVDETRSKSVDKAALVAEYQQQMEDGRQQALASFDREGALQRQQQALRTIDESASKVCGTLVKTQVDWKNLSDEQLNNLSISGYCGQVATEIESLCRKDAEFKDKITGISEVNCAFGNAVDLQQDANRLVFRTPETETRSQRGAISEFLQNL